MAALTVGAKAPEFELKAMDGRRFVLRDELARGPLVLAFFKVSCPTCQYAFPFLERLDQRLRAQVCQRSSASRRTNPKPPRPSPKNLASRFPCCSMTPRHYPVSNAYGLTNVPTMFWIAQDGEIEISSVGWVKADFTEINRKMAEAGKSVPAVLFKPGEDVRDFRAG